MGSSLLAMTLNRLTIESRLKFFSATTQRIALVHSSTPPLCLPANRVLPSILGGLERGDTSLSLVQLKGKAKVDEDCVVVKSGKEDDDCVVTGSTPSSKFPPKRKRAYEYKRHWQDTWATKFPWEEPLVSEDESIAQVECKFFLKVEGRKKLLASKSDNLWKHIGRRLAPGNMGKIKKGDYYYLKDNVHARNEKTFHRKPQDTILEQVVQASIVEQKKKRVQFVVLFHLFSLGRPMTDFGATEMLLV